VRITSGIYKGRVIQRVDTELTRETSDKVKQAMFNMLFDVKNQVVLDLFAGSGQLTFEALSRGAKHIIAVDYQKEAILTILDNAMMLGCQKQVTLVEQKITPQNTMFTNKSIDIIIMDPPYDYTQYEALIYELPVASHLIVEASAQAHLPQYIHHFALKKEKKYGKKKLFYYQFNKSSLD